MKKTAKKPVKRWETHVRLDTADKTALEAIAKRESRSATAQIAVFVRQGISASKP